MKYFLDMLNFEKINFTKWQVYVPCNLYCDYIALTNAINLFAIKKI